MHTRNEYMWGRVKMPRYIPKRNMSPGVLYLSSTATVKVTKLHCLFFKSSNWSMVFWGVWMPCWFVTLFVLPTLGWMGSALMLLRHSVRHSLSLGYNWNGSTWGLTLAKAGGVLGCFPPQNGVPPPLPLPLSPLLFLCRILIKNIYLLCQASHNTNEGSLDNQEFVNFGMLFCPHWMQLDLGLCLIEFFDRFPECSMCLKVLMWRLVWE